MNLFKWLKPAKSPPVNKKKKLLGDIKQFDDVWIKISDTVFEGWITEIVQDKINIVYTDSNKKLQDISFTIERPLDRTILIENEKTLILNEYDK